MEDDCDPERDHDIIPGDNDYPSRYMNYKDAPINLTRIPEEVGSGTIFDVPIERPVAG